MNYLKVSAVIKTSTVNGTGMRYTIFTQGCTHKCPGCHSPHTWDISKGEKTHILDLFTDIIKNKKFIDGVTFSGGDPLVQYEQVLRLCKLLKVYDINVWMWTGYKMSEIRSEFAEILGYVDTIIDDTYDETKPTKKKWRGSDNQQKWDRIENKWIKESDQ